MSTATAAVNSDTVQERKKAQIVSLMRKLIDEVEKGEFYGEFSVAFTAQNGRIGHYEERRVRTYK